MCFPEYGDWRIVGLGFMDSHSMIFATDHPAQMIFITTGIGHNNYNTAQCAYAEGFVL
jgi:hypothetical protein